MVYCSEVIIGDLVCIKTWHTEGDAGWISKPTDFGIVIEIITVNDQFVLYGHKNRCYDYKIYWLVAEFAEILPDIVVEKYSDWERRFYER